MRHRPWFVGRFLIAIAITSSVAHAQYTANFQTNVISGVTSNWSTTYYIAYSNSADVLLILNGGVLSSTSALVGNSLPGSSIVSSNNSVVISGTGSAWVGNSGLYIGNRAGGNSVTVAGGGMESGYFSYVGFDDGSTSNSLLITGPSSLWSNVSLTVGYQSTGNSVTITNGGKAITDWGFVGDLSQGPTAGNNSVRVTGAGSQWSNSGSLMVGATSGGNMLIISDAGQVRSASGVVGHQSGWSNVVVVTDARSAWNNSGSFAVGTDHSIDSGLVISNGGRVADSDGYVGGPDGLNSGHNALVTGAGSVWSNSGALVVGETRGSLISVRAAQLVIAEGGVVVDASAVIGESSSSNKVLVTDVGSVWSNTGTLTIGDTAGAGNSLVISNGGQVVDNTAYMSSSSGLTSSFGNEVDVVFGGVWRNASLYIGYYGQANTVRVAAGFLSATNLVVGFNSGSCNNVLQVDGLGEVGVQNAAHNAVLEVRRGKLIVNGGLLLVDTLVVTNSCASLIHTGGTLVVSNVVLDANLFRIASIVRQGNDMLVTWMMGPGASNVLQVTSGDASGNYNANGFTDIFVVTNNPSLGTVTNYLDVGAATNVPSRYYRARLGL